MDSIPIFAKAGAFVFRQPVVQNTGEMPGQPLIVSVYPAPTSQTTLYEDEGEGLAHERGVSLRRRFDQRHEANLVLVRVSAPEGSFRPASRDLIVRLEGADARRVLVDGVEIPRLKSDDDKGIGWRLMDETVVVRIRDRWVATEIRAEF